VNNIYVEEKIMKFKERERQRIAARAWMYPAKRANRPYIRKFPFKNRLFSRKIYLPK